MIATKARLEINLGKNKNEKGKLVFFGTILCARFTAMYFVDGKSYLDVIIFSIKTSRKFLRFHKTHIFQ